ncbi:exported protein [Haemophilus influenzae]|uniref:Exported protein n=1 Tax=Haemophilus influenzae TaxID=727 RepID=A0A2X1PJ87_HAEIF|nr:exported protein [Haemophilus influenzae]
MQMKANKAFYVIGGITALVVDADGWISFLR